MLRAVLDTSLANTSLCIELPGLTKSAIFEALGRAFRRTAACDVLNKKWPRFADQMIAALSSMFKQAVKGGRMHFNPCFGMDKAHVSDPDSNREWLAAEWDFARENAPLEVLIPMMIARYAGLRGQTIVGINRKQFEDDPKGPTGKAVRYASRKNQRKVKSVLLPVMTELQAFLGYLKVQRADGLICVRDDGTAWPSEKECRPASATGCGTRSAKV